MEASQPGCTPPSTCLNDIQRAARTAGKNPPMESHGARRKPRDVAMMDGESAKGKANSEKDPKFNVEIVKELEHRRRASIGVVLWIEDKTGDSPRERY